ncbi:3-ketodihydrosphingosine protein [Penicillium canariense]|uniref:3-dehydrosphinganine reductase n=1 Tax=Penicillium canariense TaxID=189055 RepID=A0A9W9I8V5_9EURO|nr:3-ketodihydrosphingosine protein [Penicillium canariense]KAJ5168934.1 3-ketodihydrosphingosine protein [Penicillium canariense]
MGWFGKSHMPVDGLTVLLTGASEGTGRSAACQLSAKGANICIVARSLEKLEDALVEIKAAAKHPSSQRFFYISADVSEPNYAAGVVASVAAWNGGHPPDIVWCVAGLSTPMLWTDEGSLEAARRNMDVNYFGTAEMSRAILREWFSPEQKGGRNKQPKHFIMTASVLGLFGLVGYAPYTPSKWALRGLADTLAMEVKLYLDNPVKIHVVCPATITTAGFEAENRTKHAVSLEMEEHDKPQTAQEVARKAIQGLEGGQYLVTTSFLGHLMRWGAVGGSPRNNWVVDTIMGWFMPVVYFFVLRGLNGQVEEWAKKHGSPAM